MRNPGTGGTQERKHITDKTTARWKAISTNRSTGESSPHKQFMFFMWFFCANFL